MKCRVLLGLLVLVGMGSWVSCGGYSSSTAPNPGLTGTGLIFVATQGDNLLSPFKVDLATGKATTNGAGVATGTRPSAAIMTPDGNAIFVANQDTGDISRYTIKADGTLTAVTPTQAAGVNPVAMAMDAAGKFLFVLNQGAFGVTGGSSISVFSIGASGALTAGATVTGTYLDTSTAIAVVPDGKFLYVANSFNNNISAFSVDGTSGALTHLREFDGGITPSGMTVTLDNATTPSANQIFLYVSNANAGAGNISVFEVCDKASLNCSNAHADPGDLLEISGSPFVAGGEPGSMVIVNPTVITPPSGTFLYATDHKLNRILQYSISIVTGSLTPLSPASLSTGTSPVWVGGRHDGQYVFTANNGSTSVSGFAIGDPTSGGLNNTAVVPTGNSPSAVLMK